MRLIKGLMRRLGKDVAKDADNYQILGASNFANQLREWAELRDDSMLMKFLEDAAGVTSEKTTE